MARKVIVPKDPEGGRNYFLLDANVLVYRALPRGKLPAKMPEAERSRAERCVEWMLFIEKQARSGKARIYVPDIIIAERFKVLAKWYYRNKWFDKPRELDQARKRLRSFVSTSHREMAKAGRFVAVRDEPVNRDVIIGVDRFVETMFRHKLNVQIADLLLLSIAKYLIDFYDIPRERLYIVTCDKHLAKLTRRLTDLPTAIDVTEERYSVVKTVM